MGDASSCAARNPHCKSIHCLGRDKDWGNGDHQYNPQAPALSFHFQFLPIIKARLQGEPLDIRMRPLLETRSQIRVGFGLADRWAFHRKIVLEASSLGAEPNVFNMEPSPKTRLHSLTNCTIRVQALSGFSRGTVDDS